MLEISAFFFIGFTGGFGHCVLMCHPFVLYVSSKYAITKQGYSMLIPHIFYNLGRSITYAILGSIAGLLGSVLQYAGSSFIGVQKLAAIIGGIFLVVYGFLSIYGSSSIFMLSKFNISKVINKFEISNPFIFGLILGLLPCGLSMGAIIGASSSGSFFKGAILLFSFGIGTTFAMMVMALFGNIAIKYSSAIKKISSILLILMGFYFIYMGINY